MLAEGLPPCFCFDCGYYTKALKARNVRIAARPRGASIWISARKAEPGGAAPILTAKIAGWSGEKLAPELTHLPIEIRRRLTKTARQNATQDKSVRRWLNSWAFLSC